MSALNEEEKVKVRHHLGYLNVQGAQTFVLGSPAAVETQFMIEGAMDRILPQALGEVRRHLQVLDTIEGQMIQNLELLQVTELGELKINSTGEHREQVQLRQQYKWWQTSMANLFGIMPNPFDKRSMNTGGPNVRVG